MEQSKQFVYNNKVYWPCREMHTAKTFRRGKERKTVNRVEKIEMEIENNKC